MQISMPPPRKSALETIGDALSLVSSVYGIKTAVEQQEVNKLNKQIKEEELANTKLQSTLIKEGAFSEAEFNEKFIPVVDKKTFKQDYGLPEDYSRWREVRVYDPRSPIDAPKFKNVTVTTADDISEGLKYKQAGIEENRKKIENIQKLEGDLFDKYRNDLVIKKMTDQLLTISQADATMDLVRKGDIGALGTAATIVAGAIQAGVLTNDDFERGSGVPKDVFGRTSDAIAALSGLSPANQVATLENLLTAAKTNAVKKMKEQNSFYADLADKRGLDIRNIIPTKIIDDAAKSLEQDQNVAKTGIPPTFSVIPRAQAAKEENIEQSRQNLQNFLKGNPK